MSESDGPADGLRRPALYDQHRSLGAKFAAFGGWEMPLEYAGVVSEHTAVRESVGLFDVSHLGKLVVRGEGAQDLVNSALTNDLGKIAPGKAQYTLCCDPDSGGIIDDLICYLYGDDHVLLMPNAANSAEVQHRLEAAAPAGVSITDHHDDLVALAVQGPRSVAVLEAMGMPTGHPYMSFAEARYDDAAVVVCRSGYTGERGYELLAPAWVAAALWQAVLEAGASYGIVPCGLGARDTLRTEMGYPLHGQDITREVTPNQALLGWAVGWRKPAFWGREALLAEKEQGPRLALRGLLASGRGIPRPGMSVLLTSETPIGAITSGTFSPSLRKGVALALIDRQVEYGAEVTVDVRGRPQVFAVTRPPFVRPEVKEA